MMMAGVLVQEFMDQAEKFEPVRYPVLNAEPRVQLDGRLWHLIHERDGGVCWMCGCAVAKGSGEIDHLVPRSSFGVEEVLTRADRSWNLRLACVNCNQLKSNFTVAMVPRTLGITTRCWDCHERVSLGRPDPDIDLEATKWWRESQPEIPAMSELAYCGTCGVVSCVPGEEWML